MLLEIPDSRAGGLLKEILRGMLAELSVRLEVPTENAKILQALNDAKIDANTEQSDALTVAIMRAAQSIGIRLAPVELTSPEIWELLLDGFSIAAVQ